MIKKIHLNDIEGTCKWVPINKTTYNHSLRNIKWGVLSFRETLLIWKLMDYYYREKKYTLERSAMKTHETFPHFNSGRHYTVKIETIAIMYIDHLNYKYHWDRDMIDVYYNKEFDKDDLKHILQVEQYV